MKRTSIVTRVGAIVAALVIGQAILFSVGGVAAFRSQAFPARIQLIDNTVILLRLAVLHVNDEEELRKKIDGMSTMRGFGLAIYDHQGRLLYGTRNDVGLQAQLRQETMDEARLLNGRALFVQGRLPTENSAAIATLPDGAPAAFVAFAESGTPQHVSRGIVAAFLSQIVGVVFFTLLVTGILSLRARKSLREIEHVVTRMADGDLTIRLPLRGNDEVTRVAAGFNRMADTLAERIAQLRHVEAERTRMFAAFTHEISTPLTSVLGYLESLRLPEVGDDPATRQRYIDIAYAQARALDALAEDLATLSRLNFDGITLEACEFDLGAWAKTEIAPFEERGKSRAVTIQLVAPEVVLVRADPQRLGQVLRILLDNALRHTRDDSVVVLEIRADSQNVVLELRDHGPGVAPDQLEHLGEPLHRADPSRSRNTGGRGLGLSIARGIVKAHGGQLQFASPAGSGLVVTVRLPRG